MDVIRIIIDGAVLSALVITVLYIRKGQCAPFFFAGLLFMVAEVYLIYSHQENSDLFFWHGYLSWTVANLASLAYVMIREAPKGKLLRNVLMEKLLLWQFVTVTVFAGFSLCVGWLIKLYVRF